MIFPDYFGYPNIFDKSASVYTSKFMTCYSLRLSVGHQLILQRGCRIPRLTEYFEASNLWRTV